MGNERVAEVAGRLCFGLVCHRRRWRCPVVAGPSKCLSIYRDAEGCCLEAGARVAAPLGVQWRHHMCRCFARGRPFRCPNALSHGRRYPRWFDLVWDSRANSSGSKPRRQTGPDRAVIWLLFSFRSVISLALAEFKSALVFILSYYIINSVSE